jgi:hypothetical protein
MLRFTLRDLFWLTAFVAVAIVWLMDRQAILRERAELAKREAELTSRAKMWENEANRAEKRQVDTRDELTRLHSALSRHRIAPSELTSFKNQPPLKKLIFVDSDTKK